MKPSRSCAPVPSVRRDGSDGCDPARRLLHPGADPERTRRFELTARIIVAYLAEDPFGPRPLPPLLDRVRNALRASEATGQVDRGSLVRLRGAAEGVPPFNDLKVRRDMEPDRRS